MVALWWRVVSDAPEAGPAMKTLSRSGSKLLGGRSEKTVFEIYVTSDQANGFRTEIAASMLKESLHDNLLVPFIQQVKHQKGTQIACSYVDVNGTVMRNVAELQRPLKDFVVQGEATRVTITLVHITCLQKAGLMWRMAYSRGHTCAGSIALYPG